MMTWIVSMSAMASLPTSAEIPVIPSNPQDVSRDPVSIYPPPAKNPEVEQPAPVQPPSLDSVGQRPLFADLEARKWLAEKGVTLAGRITLQPAANFGGYKGNGFSLVHQSNFSAAFDLERLGVVPGGTFKIGLTDRLGDSVNVNRTGSLIFTQGFYGQSESVRLSELSYEQILLDKKLAIKVGFAPMGADFGKLPYICNLMNSGICGHALGPTYSSGWRNDPTGQWGVRVKWTSKSGWYLQAGAYDVTPIRITPGHGFYLGFEGVTGAYFPIEAGYSWGKSPSDYAGTIRVGAYYDTSKAPLLGRPSAFVKGRSGLILQGAQQLWKPEANTVRGIAVFGVFTIADKASGLIRRNYEIGASWRGMLASRPDDIASIGWVRLNVNDHVNDGALLSQRRTNEQMFEVNYGFQVAPWLIARTVLNYNIRPGGYPGRQNAFMVAAHIQATL